jgi:hypothetical protein
LGYGKQRAGSFEHPANKTSPPDVSFPLAKEDEHAVSFEGVYPIQFPLEIPISHHHLASLVHTDRTIAEQDASAE